MSVDVTVLGMIVPTCVLADIGMDVPHQRTVTIPGEKALKSKDLWRSIGQKSLMRLPNGPGRVPPPVLGDHSNDTVLQRLEALEQENHQIRVGLQEQAVRLERFEKESEGKLDEVLRLLRSGIVMTATSVSPSKTVPHQDSGVVEDAPIFIPGTIAPANASVRIEKAESEGDGKSLSEASGKLRGLRKAK